MDLIIFCSGRLFYCVPFSKCEVVAVQFLHSRTPPWTRNPLFLHVSRCREHTGYIHWHTIGLFKSTSPPNDENSSPSAAVSETYLCCLKSHYNIQSITSFDDLYSVIHSHPRKLMNRVSRLQHSVHMFQM